MKGRLTLVIVLLAVAATGVSAQSLGELAKQEEARRKAIKSPGKIYTNDSLRKEPSSNSPAPTPPPAAAAPAPAGTPAQAAATPASTEQKSSPPAGARKDEAYWKNRLQTTRDALERAQIFADALQSRINALATDFVNRDDPAQRAVIANDRQRALAELERVRQEIQANTKALKDIQEEARRAGVPPGWLR